MLKRKISVKKIAILNKIKVAMKKLTKFKAICKYTKEIIKLKKLQIKMMNLNNISIPTLTLKKEI